MTKNFKLKISSITNGVVSSFDDVGMARIITYISGKFPSSVDGINSGELNLNSSGFTNSIVQNSLLKLYSDQFSYINPANSELIIDSFSTNKSIVQNSLLEIHSDQFRYSDPAYSDLFMDSSFGVSKICVGEYYVPPPPPPGITPDFRGIGANHYTYPTGIYAGDRLLCCMLEFSTDNTSGMLANGWTLVKSIYWSGYGYYTKVFTKVASGTENGTTESALTSNWGGIIAAYSASSITASDGLAGSSATASSTPILPVSSTPNTMVMFFQDRDPGTFNVGSSLTEVPTCNYRGHMTDQYFESVLLDESYSGSSYPSRTVNFTSSGYTNATIVVALKNN